MNRAEGAILNTVYGILGKDWKDEHHVEFCTKLFETLGIPDTYIVQFIPDTDYHLITGYTYGYTYTEVESITESIKELAEYLQYFYGHPVRIEIFTQPISFDSSELKEGGEHEGSDEG